MVSLFDSFAFWLSTAHVLGFSDHVVFVPFSDVDASNLFDKHTGMSVC